MPLSAQAQQVPGWLVAGALSPVVALIFCIVLAVVSGSLRRAGWHLGWLLVWIIWFALAAYFVENDHFIWTPMALFALHFLLLPVLIVSVFIKR